MKRIVPAVLCIITALAMSAASYGYIRTRAEKLSGMAEELLNAEGENAREKAEALCAEWKRERTLFGALLKHSDADELEKYFLLIEYYAFAEAPEKLYDAAENCRNALSVILRGEKPGPANIF